MIILSAIFFFGLALILFILAWRSRRRESPRPGRLMRRSEVLTSLRMGDVARLRKLRWEIETGADYDGQAALLLYDVCRALRLGEAQTQQVVGPITEWILLDGDAVVDARSEEEE
jgi:hypothetical protein